MSSTATPRPATTRAVTPGDHDPDGTATPTASPGTSGSPSTGGTPSASLPPGTPSGSPLPSPIQSPPGSGPGNWPSTVPDAEWLQRGLGAMLPILAGAVVVMGLTLLLRPPRGGVG